MSETPRGLFATILVIFLLAAIVASGSVFYCAIAYPEQAIQKGPWGDFVGGTLNPILTFFSFMGILVSIALQRQELSLSRKELERSANALEKQIASIEYQNFEATFFQMLNTYNSIVESIDLVNSETKRETRGRDCFRVFYTRLNKIYRENIKKSQGKHRESATLRLSYYTFWKDNQLELGHYFRFLYNVFRFLDETPVSRPHHGKLLRAQLSDQELLLLFYNCLYDHGRNFRKYAVKYELFDNLPTVRLLEDDHIKLMDKAAFGNNSMRTSKNARPSA